METAANEPCYRRGIVFPLAHCFPALLIVPRQAPRPPTNCTGPKNNAARNYFSIDARRHHHHYHTPAMSKREWWLREPVHPRDWRGFREEGGWNYRDYCRYCGRMEMWSGWVLGARPRDFSFLSFLRSFLLSTDYFKETFDPRDDHPIFLETRTKKKGIKRLK